MRMRLIWALAAFALVVAACSPGDASGGQLDGKRYLSPAAFRSMTSDHIGPGSGVARDYYYFPGDGFGYGYGFAVRTDAGVSPWAGSVGQVDWGGAAGTYFWIDRQEDMVVLLMVQTPTQRGPIESALKSLIYGAFEK